MPPRILSLLHLGGVISQRMGGQSCDGGSEETQPSKHMGGIGGGAGPGPHSRSDGGQLETNKYHYLPDIRTSENLSPYWNRKMTVIS